MAWNDARQKIVREDALGSLVISVNSEGDALMQKREVRGLLTFFQILRGQVKQGTEQRLVMGSRLARRLKHLVISRVELIMQERWRKRGWRRCLLDSQHARSGASVLHSKEFRCWAANRPIEI